jgi:hypothetical protein
MAEMGVPGPKPDGHDRASSVATVTKAIDSQESVPGPKATDEEKASAVSTPHTTDSSELPTNDFKPESDIEKITGTQRGEVESVKFGGEDNDPAVLVAYPRTGSPTSGQRSKGGGRQNASTEVINRMHKFSLYETSARFYLVGADIMDKHYRVLKIDRTSPPGHLNIFEDDIVYSKREMNQLLNAIDDGNKGSGGMKLKCSAWGLLGFIRFTEAYYMLLITKRAQVAMVGGHYIYQVDDTEMIPLTTGSTSRFQKDRNPEEMRFLSILNNLDLTRSFYFSYSYNITRSLQQNIIRERTAVNEGRQRAAPDFQDMFVWNHYLLDPARAVLKNAFDWCHPIIHGYIDQSSLDIYGRKVYITIIARRSRFFAGARFLKRGANDLGYVANDVETEQIVSDVLNTSFHAPGPRLYANPNYTSYVQHRGSIPLHWTQDNTGVTPKPDIDLNLVDPFYSAAALHFDNLFERYGSPVYVLNLVKTRERTPRESKLSVEYKNGIDYLNQSLPKGHKIKYEAFDMSRASKTRGQDVIGTLEHIAEKVLRVTDFFHNGQDAIDAPRVQNGVARTNCIDCLDRTNAAQFVIGKRALGRQLQALGVLSVKTVEYDTDCVEIFTRMFHNHGDQIAVQYGGSHLVNTMATYRKINHWQSSSRDMVESFKRYYHNSFLDSQRQEAYNLFLGNYIFTQGQPMLWDLTTDYYLHHGDPRFWLSRLRRDYISWYTPQHLNRPSLPSALSQKGQNHLTHTAVASHDDYWLEYYRPLALSSFLKIFAFRLNEKSGPQRPEKFIPMHPEDFSPFVVRKKPHDQTSPGKGIKKPPRKGVTIVDPSSETDSLRNSIGSRRPKDAHFQSTDYESPAKQSILRDPRFETAPSPSKLVNRVTFPSLTASTSSGFGLSTPTNFVPADKALVNQWTLTQFYENSLNPSVPMSEQEEYSRYIEHPLNLPLVVSSETPSTDDPGALEFYEYLCMSESNVPPLEPRVTEFPNIAGTQAAFIRSSFSRPASATGFSINTPFSHHAAYDSIAPDSVPGSNKFQVSDEDVEEFEEYLKVEDNPLDVLEEDGGKKRYKAYRQWLKGKSFFKQSKVDPEWQNQLPVR